VSDPTRLVPDPKNQPSPEEKQTATIRPGSGLAILGVFVEAIRARFRQPNPWLYDSDIKETKIAIETAFNEDKAHRNFRPAIFVDHDGMNLGRTVLGDRAGQNLLTGQQGFWALDTVPILVECVAGKKNESAIVADITRLFLHASSDLIQAKFGLHEMTPVTMGRTQPFPRDKDQWVTPVTFSVQYPLRWTNKPSGPLIQEIVLRAQKSGAPTEFFELIALAQQSK
jgi:hypothetical protein